MRLLTLTFLLVALALAGCGSQSTPVPTVNTKKFLTYPDLGAAPELTNDTWLNTNASLRLANLRGKVILIDMWTFG